MKRNSDLHLSCVWHNIYQQVDSLNLVSWLNDKNKQQKTFEWKLKCIKPLSKCGVKPWKLRSFTAVIHTKTWMSFILKGLLVEVYSPCSICLNFIINCFLTWFNKMRTSFWTKCTGRDVRTSWILNLNWFVLDVDHKNEGFYHKKTKNPNLCDSGIVHPIRRKLERMKARL